MQRETKQEGDKIETREGNKEEAEDKGNTLTSKKLLEWDATKGLKWYKFDDSRVYEVANEDDVMNSDAYILFYKKKENL